MRGIYRNRYALLNNNIHMLQATVSGCYPFIRPNGLTGCKTVMNYIYHNFIATNHQKIDGVILSANWINDIKGKDSTLLIKDLKSTIAYFEKYQIKVVIIGQNESYKMTYPYIAARENEYHIKIGKKYLNKDAGQVNSFLIRNFKPYYIDIYNGGQLSGVSADNRPYMTDRNHFSKYGADRVAKKIFADTIGSNFVSYINNNPKTK